MDTFSRLDTDVVCVVDYDCAAGGDDGNERKRQETSMTKMKAIQEGMHSLPSTSGAEGGHSDPKESARGDKNTIMS